MANNIEIEALRKNEISANKQMVNVNIFTAIILIIVFLLYAFKVFPVYSTRLIFIFFPIDIGILLSSIIWVRGKSIYKAGYKYFLLFSFLIVVGLINVIIPKHGLLGYAAVIFLTNHYYNSRVVKIMFVSTLIMMLLALYAGMISGEYDINLLTEGIIQFDENGNPFIYHPNTAKERIEFLNNLAKNGENRYLKVFEYYYIPRAIFTTILFFISLGLTKRTHKLLRSEIATRQEQEKLASELNIAKEIQLKALPNEFVTGKDVEIVAELSAAKEVGGDFYDYYALDSDHIAITIGDVSGKGIPAAMFMMKAITTLKTYAQSGRHPSEILKDVNKQLCLGNDSKMFVTCFFGILNTKTGEFEYANAGHNKPIIGTRHNFKYLDCYSGFVLAAMDELILKDEVITIEKGSIITLYTDGITEARNINGEFYGDDRLIEFYNKEEIATLIDLQYELKDNISYFVKDAPQADDMTFLLLEYQGDEMNIKSIEVESSKNNLNKVLDFAHKFLEDNKIYTLGVQIDLILDELYSNVNKYAYDGDEGIFHLRMNYNKTKKELSLTLVDKGKEFNPLKTNPKKVEDKNAQEGGLGILIVKNFADSISYNRINEKNILLIKKKI